MGIFNKDYWSKEAIKARYLAGISVFKKIFLVPLELFKKDGKNIFEASIISYPVGIVKGIVKTISMPLFIIAVIGILALIFWKRIEKILVK